MILQRAVPAGGAGLVVNSRIRITGASAACANRVGNTGSMARSFWTGGANGPDQTVGIPVGYGTRGFQMPQSDGGIATTAAGVRRVGGSTSLTADLTAVGILQAAIAGSTTITAAGLRGALIQASLSGGTTITPPTLNAIGILEAAIIIGATPSADDIAQAVWGTQMAGFTSSGTFGFANKFMFFVQHNKVITDPASGTYDVYADDDVTVIYTGDLWQDAGGVTPYNGNGAERRDRLNP